MKMFGLLLIVAALAAIYFIWVRPYLKTLPSLAEIYANEESWWATIKLWVIGRRTLLIGIYGELFAMAPDLLAQLQLVDLKTMLHLPDEWAMWVNAAVGLGMLIFRSKAKP